MNDPIQAMLEAGLIPSTPFSPTSRYAGLGLDALAAQGESAPIPYVRRRLVPPPERFAEVSEVVVIEGDRRDNLAAQHLGAAELWWRLADANGAIDPRQLTERPGQRLRITLAEGIPGDPDG